MLVFMTGLIYLNGCKAVEKRAYAPDGSDYQPPHHASLWVEEALVNTGATTWADSVPHTVNGVDVIEFQILQPSELTFPDEGVAMNCNELELDKKLPKLKKKKKNGSEVVFDVGPGAETIAEVAIHGGTIEPKRFDQIGLIQWTINNPDGLQITSEAGIIALNTPSAEVVFSNTHDLFAPKDSKKHGDHVDLFIKLSPEAEVTVVSKKFPGSVGQVKTGNPILNLMKKNVHIEGETPACCCTNNC